MESTTGMVIRFIIFFPAIILLIYVLLKYGGGRLQGMQNGRYIKVLEKTPLSKETSLMVIKLGSKAYVVSSTVSKTEILMEISNEDLNAIEEEKKIPQYKSLDEFLTDVKNKLHIKKED